MFIDEINRDDCWILWNLIYTHPVKTAREFFPNMPKNYVKVTKLIGGYLANKGTALGLLGAEQQERRDIYIKIAARIYTEIPDWGRSINTDYLNLK